MHVSALDDSNTETVISHNAIQTRWLWNHRSFASAYVSRDNLSKVSAAPVHRTPLAAGIRSVRVCLCVSTCLCMFGLTICLSTYLPMLSLSTFLPTCAR